LSAAFQPHEIVGHDPGRMRRTGSSGACHCRPAARPASARGRVRPTIIIWRWTGRRTGTPSGTMPIPSRRRRRSRGAWRSGRGWR